MAASPLVYIFLFGFQTPSVFRAELPIHRALHLRTIILCRADSCGTTWPPAKLLLLR